MYGIRIQYIRLEIKRTAIAMRRVALWFVLMAAMLTVLVGGIFYFLYQSVEAKPIQVALVVPEDQKEVLLVSKLISGLDSVKNICEFVYPGEEELSGLFEQGGIQAAILFTEDFYNDVNEGKNTPVTILLADHGQTSATAFFQEIMYAGLYLIDVTEAACYAMSDTVRTYEAVMTGKEAAQGLLNDYVADAFYAREALNMEIVSATGEVELPQYYASVLLLLLLLLCGSQFYVLYDVRNIQIEEKLRVYGAGNIFRSLCKLSLMTGVLWILELLYMYGIQLAGARTGLLDGTFLPDQAVCLLLPAASAACFYHGIFQSGPDQKGRKRLAVPAVLGILILSGCLVPVCYLPGAAAGVSAWMPFTAYRCFLEQILSGKDPDGQMLLIWSLLFLGLGAIGNRIGKGQTGEERCGSPGFWRRFAINYTNGGIRSFWLRLGLLVKWQWKKKTPVAAAVLFGCLVLLCTNISLPDKEQNHIWICSADQDAITDYGAFILERSTFTFDFENDETQAVQAVRTGKILAAAVKKEEGVTIYTAAYSPKVMAAKETIMAIFLAEKQDRLLETQSEKVFGANAPAVHAKLQQHFRTYLHSGQLLNIVFKEEKEEKKK